MKALGCFNDNVSDRLLPELLDNHRDRFYGHVGYTIDWMHYPQSLEEYVKFDAIFVLSVLLRVDVIECITTEALRRTAILVMISR